MNVGLLNNDTSPGTHIPGCRCLTVVISFVFLIMTIFILSSHNNHSLWSKPSHESRCYLLYLNHNEHLGFYNNFKQGLLSYTRHSIREFSTFKHNDNVTLVDLSLVPKSNKGDPHLHVKSWIINNTDCDRNILIDFDATILRSLDYLFNIEEDIALVKGHWHTGVGYGMIIIFKMNYKLPFDDYANQSEMDVLNKNGVKLIFDESIGLDCDCLDEKHNYVSNRYNYNPLKMKYIHYSCYGKFDISERGSNLTALRWIREMHGNINPDVH